MTAAHDLRQPLERLYREFDYTSRVELDAIRFPLRYPDSRDREIVALLSACLAYGRVDLFSGALEGVLAKMGPSPAAFVTGFDPRRDAGAFADFWYRFNRPRDLAAFCIAARDLLGRYGTLEKCFLAGDDNGRGPIGPTLERFSRKFLDADLSPVFGRGRISRGYRHLFPLPSVREHQPVDRPHPPALAKLADGRGDHAEARGDRSHRPREVRLRALPQAHVRRLSRSARYGRLRALRPQNRLPALAPRAAACLIRSWSSSAWSWEPCSRG